MAYNIFERWPFTSFQNLNLDWLLKTTKEAAETAETAATTVQQYNDRLASVENDNIQQDRDIMNIQNVNNQQNQRIDTLETDVEAQEQTIRSLQGWDQEQETAINALSTRVTNLENDDNDNVKVTAQDFDSTEKNIARNNIGAGTSTVTYDDEDLVLTIEDALTGELETVPVGGGGGGNPNAVLYVQQSLTNSQKTQARQNIAAGKSTVSYNDNTGILTIIDADTGTPNAYSVPSDTVRYSAQTLTEGQKAQARTNIGVVNGNSVFLITAVYSNGEYTFDRNQADILSAIQSGMLPVVRYHTTAGQSDYHVYYEWVLDYYTYDGEEVYIYFSRVDQNGNSAQLRWYGSTGKATEISRPTLPPATSADEGKIPMVNSFGNYQLTSIPAAENTSFGT